MFLFLSLKVRPRILEVFFGQKVPFPEIREIFKSGLFLFVDLGQLLPEL